MAKVISFEIHLKREQTEKYNPIPKTKIYLYLKDIASVKEYV